MGHIITLLYAPLVARLSRLVHSPWLQRQTRPGLTWLDWGLALLLGLFIAPLAVAWLAPFTAPSTRALGSPDFGEYCWHVGLYVFDALHEWGVNRSKLAGLPAGLLAPTLGVLDSLLVSAIASHAVIIASVYIWARALHGRSAGVAAALLLGAVGPLSVIGRMVTFYPEVTAGLALASAGAACALRWRTPFTIALAGLGAGIALLIDVRGLLWALPAVGLALLAVLIGPRGRWWGIHWRALALALPLLASWHLGSWAYHEKSRSLEGSVAIYDELKLAGIPLPPKLPGAPQHTRFLWGHSDPRYIPQTLAHLRQESSYIPEWFRDQRQVRAGWKRSGAPWLLPVLTALAIAAVGLRRRPLLLVALLGSILPFVVSMQGAVIAKSGNLRFVASAMVFIPVVVGIAMGILVDGPLHKRGAGVDAPGRPLALILLGITLTGAILGVPHTWLSPIASWRIHYPQAEAGFLTAMRLRSGEATTQDKGMEMCVFGLTRVEGDGTLTGALPGGGTQLEGYRRFK